MKVKFETCFRGLIAGLLIAIFWCWFAAAQTNTNAPAAETAATNHVSSFVRGVEHLDASYLTFGLDRIAPLREVSFLGEPLWKYIASFIYIFLA